MVPLLNKVFYAAPERCYLFSHCGYSFDVQLCRWSWGGWCSSASCCWCCCWTRQCRGGLMARPSSSAAASPSSPRLRFPPAFLTQLVLLIILMHYAASVEPDLQDWG